MTDPETFSKGASSGGHRAGPGNVPMPEGPRAVRGANQNTLGKYRLIAELAKSEIATVYLGVAQGPAGFSKLLVIKELRTEAADDPDFLRMFLDEARLAARLNHANIVQTYEVESEGGRYFMAMEYLEGQSLYRLLDLSRRPGPGPKPSRALLLRVLSEALSGLHHAHELCDFNGQPLNVVHRDVSPKNIFLTYDGRTKLTDFGIAKAKDALHVTIAGMLKGKVTYMAPEQAQNQPVDRRADVFAAGVILWEMLVGRKLWDKVPINEVLLRLTRYDLPPPPSILVADLPSELDGICARAMAPVHGERYATALEFREDLERYLRASGEEIHPREVGQFIASTYAEERRTRRTLVDAHVKRLSDSEGGEIASLSDADQRDSVGRIRAVQPPRGSALPPQPAPAAFSPLPTPMTAASSQPAPRRRRRTAVLVFALLALLGSIASAAFGLKLALHNARSPAHANTAFASPEGATPAAAPKPAPSAAASAAPAAH